MTSRHKKRLSFINPSLVYTASQAIRNPSALSRVCIKMNVAAECAIDMPMCFNLINTTIYGLRSLEHRMVLNLCDFMANVPDKIGTL